ncbi:glycogen debranching enzyme [Vibrio maritimus]|uniref:Glycogen debranching enzyme n=1 Tax=Vibrio maritimus TaxID=990268 RepID=A0A090T9T3_9VIBR|nr:glycogen debranching enzyme [Vibrio maritimus]
MTQHQSSPYPLGATLDEVGCNFAIHAPDCEAIYLALYDDNNKQELFPLFNNYAGIKHIHLSGIKAGQRYGFVIESCEERQYIADPYAKALDKALHYIPPFSAEKALSCRLAWSSMIPLTGNK